MLESRGYPQPAFYFSVTFEKGDELDTSFQEVTGIGSELDTEPYVEGGENTRVYELVKGFKHPKLVLKRGIATMKSPLVKWCKEVLEDTKFPIEPQALYIYLLNEKGEPVRGWGVDGAYPVKWEIDGFNSTENKVAIETITLNYSYSIRAV